MPAGGIYRAPDQAARSTSVQMANAEGISFARWQIEPPKEVEDSRREGATAAMNVAGFTF